MSKKNDIELSSIYEGDLYKDLPLTMHFLKSMVPETAKKEDDEKAKKGDSMKSVESPVYRSKMYLCYEFYRPISKLIYPPKNESEISK